jgi:hypothetical protein
MNSDPNTDGPFSNRVPAFWVWVIIGVALALLLSWFTRFPWR